VISPRILLLLLGGLGVAVSARLAGARMLYRTAGARSQQAFWGGGALEASMLHQFAAAT